MDNKFNIVDTFSDEKTRARVVLAFYLCIIVVLIIFIRLGDSSTNSDKVEENVVESDVSETTENNYEEPYTYTKEDYEDDNSLYNRFSFLRSNNYSFEIEIDYDKDVIISGKRYNNKYKMNVNDKLDNLSIDYLVKDGVIKAYHEGEYKEVDMPVTLIDYFNNYTLYNILNDCTLVEEKNNEVKYSISNKKLKKYLLSDFSYFLDDDDNKNNEVVMKLKNNKMYEIHFKINGSKDLEVAKEYVNIAIKYDNYTQIDDFNIDF